MVEKNIPITREEFREAINFIQERKEKEFEINKYFSEEFEDSIFLPYSKYEPAYIKLLKIAMHDGEGTDSNIEYFIYELNFGREEMAKDCITMPDGRIISLQTIDQLYDLLVEEY